MQRVIPLRIDDDADLRATIESFRLIQEQVSEVAHAYGKKLSAVQLHRLAYPLVKGKLKSQLLCTAIRNVASEYNRVRRRRRAIHGPIHFSKPRALFLIGKAKRDACPPRRETIRVWTTAGRKNIGYSVPKQFEELIQKVATFDALSVSIKKGRLVASLSVTMKPVKSVGTLPAGVSFGKSNEVAVVDSEGRSLRVIAVAQNVMEETYHKTRRRLQKRLSDKKADGRETRSMRRVLKRLSRKRYMRTKAFSHTAARRLVDWLGQGSILAIEDLRLPPPSRRKEEIDRPHFYENFRRRVEEKAAAEGIPVHYVTVDDSGRRCSLCGAEGTTRRGEFSCMQCGNCGPLSKNAALNVRNKFTVTRPWADVSQP